MYTRREFGLLSAGALFLPRSLHAIESKVAGVRIGAQSYSFRELPRPEGAADMVDVIVKAMTECGLGELELFAAHLEPRMPFVFGPRFAMQISPRSE